jgi:hypothetical protein
MFNDLSLEIFIALLVELFVLIMGFLTKDEGKRALILVIGTTIAGIVALGPKVVTALNPPPEPTRTAVPKPSPNPVTHIWDDFNNPAYDGKIDSRKWTLDGDCNYSQDDGSLLIRHEPSAASWSNCSFSGPFAGVGGSKFESFEARFLVQNDFQGICCSGISLTVASSAFSGGGGSISCALHAGPGWVAGVFSVNTDGYSREEYRAEIETTYSNWHTLRVQISPSDYKISCFLDGELLGSTIPKDSLALYKGTFARSIDTGWPKDTGGSFQIDDVKINP